MNFATQLRTLRMLRGLSQVDLEKLTGIPNNVISHMETGKVVPVGDWEAKIKLAVGWPEDEAAFAFLAGIAQQPAEAQ